MFRLLCIGFVAVLIASCSDQPNDNKIKGSHNYEGKPFTITVNVYPTRMAMESAVRGMNTESIEGFAAWTLRKDDLDTMTGCTLYLQKPTGVRDSKQLQTWGHELAHCVYGSYHRKGER